MLSLAFFLALPAVDPYLIMKVIVTALDALQVVPIYFIVRYFTRSNEGATVAGFVAMVTPSDFVMISWGGYANIAGFLLIAVLAYFVMREKPVAVAIVSAVLFLTHHLSMLFAIAVLFSYFVITWWKTRKLPPGLIALFAAMTVAYAAFYWRTLMPLYELYTTFAPRYAEFRLPADWPNLFGLPLLIMAMLGIGLWAYQSKVRFAKADLFLYMWLLWPLLLGYSFLFGIHWHVVRWIYYLQQPACVWAGIAVARFGKRKWAIAIVLVIFILQWISTMQGYQENVLSNSNYSY
jgi:hypothetical protein